MWIFLLSLNPLCIILFNSLFCFVLFCFRFFKPNWTLDPAKKQRMLWQRFKSPAYAITWPGISLANTLLKFIDHKDDGNFSGSGNRISITMTTAWRCAPYQRMRRIQITQWSGSGHAIYSRKSSLDAGGFAEESGIVLVHCLAAPRQIVWPLREHTRVRQYLPAVTAIKISALLPGAILTSKSGEHLDQPQPGLM